MFFMSGKTLPTDREKKTDWNWVIQNYIISSLINVQLTRLYRIKGLVFPSKKTKTSGAIQ